MQPSTPDNNEVLVRVNGVSKKFCRDLKKSLLYGLQDVASELLPFGRKKKADGNKIKNQQLSTNNHSPLLRNGEFWANKDISFELRRGECLGLLGRNGAGKTTLLKMLNGLIKPDEGTIEMSGRVGALIALGAGFNPILTGRENIYVNGSILGLSKGEIDSKIAEIIEFAEVPEFIDSPVQSYSSGMQVRLGFAIATALEPDVLIIDEVLAVGDTNFKVKCLNRISKLLSKTAVIFVSHNINQISRICNRCVVLTKGQMVLDSKTEECIEKYNRLNDSNQKSNSTLAEGINSMNIRFENLHLKFGESLSFTVTIRSKINRNGCFIRLIFLDSQENSVAEWNSNLNNQLCELKIGTNTFKATVPVLRFKAGTYWLRFFFVDPSGVESLAFSDLPESLQVVGYSLGHSVIQL